MGCDFVVTRIYLQYDEKETDYSEFRFKVADIDDHSALIKQSVDWVREFEEDRIFLTVESTIVIIENWLECRYIVDPKDGNN